MPVARTTEDADADEEDDEDEDADVAGLTAELVAWAVGVAMGRFDVRLATGERAAPPEPEPFDPLPVCSPGMLTGDDGLPLEAPPAGYPIDFPASGILVDDPGHASDLTAAVRRVFEMVFGSSADAIWSEAADLLDPSGMSCAPGSRSASSSSTCKRHSKSRRKAPILWQLAHPLGALQRLALCPPHDAATASSGSARTSPRPKLALEQRRLDGLITDGWRRTRAPRSARPSPSRRPSSRSCACSMPRSAGWRPCGSPTSMTASCSSSRRCGGCVPGHKPWQKELKTKWAELVKGKYDWAHLAMHLWPERVVPKCATDRSLAIAHGLEDVFWSEDADGKWQARKAPTTPLETLIAERTSPAVKAALEDLLGAGA